MDESELIKRLTALEAASKAVVEIESFYVVHDPAHIRIWCPRTECPNLGRKLTVENQTYRKSEVSALDDDGNIIQFDEEEDGVVEQAVVIDGGPQRSQFPLVLRRATPSRTDCDPAGGLEVDVGADGNSTN